MSGTHTVTRELHGLAADAAAPGDVERHIDRDFLAGRIGGFERHFYVCGPPGFMTAVNTALGELCASPQNLVFER